MPSSFAVGAPGIPDAVVGQDVVSTAGWFAAPVMERLVEQLTPVIQNAVQAAVQAAVQPVHGLLVRESNFSRRLNNRTQPGLVPLLKEGHPQQAAPAAGEFGALPPPGVFFPATLAEVGHLSHAQLDALAAFYEAGFGTQNMPRAQRTALLVDFLQRM